MPSTTNTFDPNTAIPDLHDKVYVVTGGSAGTGFGVCAHLLQHKPARIYLLGKIQEHLAEATEGLKSYGEAQRVSPLQVDLEHPAATDRAARQPAARPAPPRRPGPQRGPGRRQARRDTRRRDRERHMQATARAQFHPAMTLVPAPTRGRPTAASCCSRRSCTAG